jgi:hypothetical protein
MVFIYPIGRTWIGLAGWYDVYIDLGLRKNNSDSTWSS